MRQVGEEMVRRLSILGLLILVAAFASCRAAAPVDGDATAAPTAAADAATSANADRRLAAAFTLTTPAGDTLSLEDYRGKLVLLNFWATWCPTCRAEMETLENYYQAHQAEGVVVLGINYKESAQAVASFVAQRELTFPFVLDEDGKVAAAYGLVGLPVSYFIDCEGRVIGFWPGAVTDAFLEQTLTPFLAECAAEK